MAGPPDHASDHADVRPQELTREDLAGVDAFCPVCGYNLRDGTGGRCPECGETLSFEDVFPAHDLSLFPAFDTKRPVPPRERVPAAIMATIAFLFAGIMMAPAYLLALGDWRFKILSVVLVAIGFGLFVPVLRRSRGRGRWTLIVGGAVLAAFSIIVAMQMKL